MTINVAWQTRHTGAWTTTRVEIDDPADIPVMLHRLETEGGLDAAAVHLARPRVAPHDHPDHDLRFGVRRRDQGPVGAIFYADGAGSWVTLGDGPEDGPVYAEMEFPARCEITLSQLEGALVEFLRTHQRPTIVDWQPIG
ncbi:Imm1 family immunity protein [Allokutzneria sp. NRRL B-24872]|uniref:Imm1 family immunity protein n=1 Tax=Allokutzneria sp. NRRL B-24872 TaxID=1137961 RepID=UPI000A39CEA8|nr:Imm1 family immunity protein [Allokutzneria sp. NRRL B-24872]